MTSPEEKTPKSIRAIATLALVLVAGGTVGAVAYDSVVNEKENSTVLLGTLATASVGAIVVLASGKHED